MTMCYETKMPSRGFRAKSDYQCREPARKSLKKRAIARSFASPGRSTLLVIGDSIRIQQICSATYIC